MVMHSDFGKAIHELGPSFRARAAAADREGSFVTESYAELKRRKLFSAGVPRELGGMGASHAELCQGLQELARYCGSSSLALSMHTHLVAAAVWRLRHGQPAEALLRRIATEELVLISTGAGDWLDSVGRAERVSGGYRISATKRFCSGAPAGDLLMTSVPYQDPERGSEVLHFALSLRAPGVTLLNDWDTLGMRGTGSCSVELRDVFVADEAIGVRRPAGQWHPSWSVIMGVAPPIYMAPYVGIAEQAAAQAKDIIKQRGSVDELTLSALGALENALTLTQLSFAAMIELTREYDFEPTVERASQMLTRKTLTTNALLDTVRAAVELAGGSALFCKHGIERLWRDVQGAPFHPLPEAKQRVFTGRVALGLPPVG
jgi:alkylation response protein AidB-like acyl-CoA dehydrogenase